LGQKIGVKLTNWGQIMINLLRKLIVL
jgi:hypothetical protein